MLLRAISSPDGQVGQEGAALSSLVVAEMELAAPVLKYAQFYSMTGSADNITKPATVAGGSSRELNDDYTAATTDVAEVNLTLKIMGDKIKTDQALSRRGYTINDERARQLGSFARGLGRHFTDQMINGTGDDGEITGLTTLITGTQIIKFGGNNGATVTLGNDNTAKSKQQAFLEALDNLILSVPGGAQVVMMNYYWQARLKAIAREYVQIATVEAFGVKSEILTYNNVPIIDAGYAKNQTSLIIPIAETLGTSSDCSSAYALRFGEKEDLTFATNKGMQVKDLGVVGVHYTTSLEMDIEQSLVDVKAAARLAGLRLA